MDDKSYVKNNIHPIFESLMVQLLIDKPTNIVDAMQKWLQERAENGPNNEQDKKNKNVRKDLQENRNYITNQIHPIFEKLVVDLLLSKPDDPTEFMIEWLKEHGTMFETQIENHGGEHSLEQVQKQKKPKQEDMPSSDEEDEDNEEFVDEIPIEKLQEKGKQGMRASVSAEAYGQFNNVASFKPRVIPKNQEQKDRIIKKISQSFMFSCLADKERQIIIEAMEEKKFKPGEWIIKQGDDGNELYVVDTGELDCFKKFQPNEEPKFLKTYHPGESFGELALLYNSARQASIRAKTDAVLWCLDRDTFNNIVKLAAMKKREEYEKFLTKVDLISDMSDAERGQIIDSLKQIKCKKGDYVVRQGERGDMFFMVEEGELIALKVTQPGGQPEEVFQYQPGNFFGELSLMGDQPRAASILCKTDCLLVGLDRYSFKRLLGNVENILQRNAEKYKKIQNQSLEKAANSDSQ